MNGLVSHLLSGALAQRIGWALVHFLWQGLAAALLLALALLLMRRRSPQARWAACCAGLGLMAVLPVLTACLVSVPGKGSPEAAAATEAVTLPAPLYQPADGTLALPIAAVPAAAAQQPAGVVEPVPVPWNERLETVLRPALPWVVLAWLAGVLALSVWHMGGWWQLRRLCRLGSRPTGDAVAAILTDLARRLGLSGPVRMLESAAVGVPVVVGWLRPAIFLPASALTGLTPEQLTAVIAHELAHIRRHDCLIRLLQAAVETLLFYHPAVWWASGRMRQESELCCDALALEVCGDRQGYARALARVVELAGRSPRPWLAASGGRLLERVRRVLGIEQAKEASTSRWLAGFVAAVFVALLVGGLYVGARSFYGASDASARSAEPLGGEPGRQFKATLANGVTVELIGVSYHPSQGQPWWTPDGSPLSEAPYEQLRATVQGVLSREFAVRMSGGPADSVGLEWHFDPGYGYAGGGQVGKPGEDRSSLWAAAASIVEGHDTCSVRLGVAAEPWETIAASDGVSRTSVGRALGGVAFSEGYQAGDEVRVTVTDDLAGYSRRVVAVDSAGGLHPPSRMDANAAGKAWQTTAAFRELALEQIKGFRLEARPYRWVEFRSVSLQPGHATWVEVSVDGTPYAAATPRVSGLPVPQGGSAVEADVARAVRTIAGASPVNMADRAEAYALLQRHPQWATMFHLADYLSSEQPDVRRAVLSAFIELDWDKAYAPVEGLTALLDDAEASTRRMALQAMLNLGAYPPPAKLLELMRKDPDYWVRSRAALALGGQGDWSVLPGIEALAADPRLDPRSVGLARDRLSYLRDTRSLEGPDRVVADAVHRFAGRHWMALSAERRDQVLEPLNGLPPERVRKVLQDAESCGLPTVAATARDILPRLDLSGPTGAKLMPEDQEYGEPGFVEDKASPYGMMVASVAYYHRSRTGQTLSYDELKKIYTEAAFQEAQTGGDPKALEEAVRRAFAFERDDATNLQLYVYLGDATWRQTPDYSPEVWGPRRHQAATVYFRGLLDAMQLSLPAEPPELPAVSTYAVDGPPEVIEQYRQKHEREMASRREAERVRELVQLRQTLTGQIVQMYARAPDAFGELWGLASHFLGDERAAQALVAAAQAYRADASTPIPALSRSLRALEAPGGGKTTGSLAFGPIIERVVNDAAEEADQVIDFDTGRLLSWPPGLGERNKAIVFDWSTGGGNAGLLSWPPGVTGKDREVVLEWATSTGADACGQTGPQGVRGLQVWLKPVRMDSGLWDTMSADALRSVFWTAGSNLDRLFMPAGTPLPTTYGFRTPQGGMGILQIVGFTENPKGVRIRYKMLQEDLAWGEALNGLQVGLGYEHGRRPYRIGETVSFVCKARNISDRTTPLSYGMPGIPCTLEVFDSDGRHAYLWLPLGLEGYRLGMGGYRVEGHSIEPGKTVLLYDLDLTIWPILAQRPPSPGTLFARPGTYGITLTVATLGGPRWGEQKPVGLLTGQLELQVMPAAPGDTLESDELAELPAGTSLDDVAAVLSLLGRYVQELYAGLFWTDGMARSLQQRAWERSCAQLSSGELRFLGYVATQYRDATSRAIAVEALGCSGWEGAGQYLTLALSDVSEQVRRNAAGGLGELGPKANVPRLLAMLSSDPVADVRAGAAFALGRIGSHEAVEGMQEALKTETDIHVREAITTGLRWIREKTEGNTQVPGPRSRIATAP